MQFRNVIVVIPIQLIGDHMIPVASLIAALFLLVRRITVKPEESA